jgi:hypothetical protein
LLNIATMFAEPQYRFWIFQNQPTTTDPLKVAFVGTGIGNLITRV